MLYQVSKQMEHNNKYIFLIAQLVPLWKLRARLYSQPCIRALNSACNDRLAYETHTAVFPHLTHSEMSEDCATAASLYLRTGTLSPLIRCSIRCYCRDAFGLMSNYSVTLEDLQSKLSAEDWLIHEWRIISMMVKKSIYEQMIWTKNLCVNIDLDTGWLVACVCLALIPKHHNLFHKLGEKGYSICWLLHWIHNTQYMP